MTLNEYFLKLYQNTIEEANTEYSLHEKIIIEIKNNPDQVLNFLNDIGLILSDEDLNENSSPVCYANSSELRKEFLMKDELNTVSTFEIWCYYYAVIKSEKNNFKGFKSITTIKFPFTKDDFFIHSKQGKALLDELLIK